MPYKDPQKQKEAVEKAVKKHRGITEGITPDRVLHEKEGITPDLPEGITLYRYVDGKRIELKEVPEGFKVLSDGQVWEPLPKSEIKGTGRIAFIQRELNDKYLIKSIERAGIIFGDRDLRYERAYSHKLWRDGQSSDEMDKATAVRLTLIGKSLDRDIKGLAGSETDMLKMVRYGINGLLMSEIKAELN